MKRQWAIGLVLLLEVDVGGRGIFFFFFDAIIPLYFRADFLEFEEILWPRMDTNIG